KASVVANGVEQSCTELTVNIDDKVIVDIVEALLKEFKNDNEVKNVIKNFYLAVESSSNDFESKYSELIADVDKFLSDIDEFEKELENINLTVVTWVDSKGEVIGREIKSTEFDGKIRYLSTHNGTKVGIEAYFLTDESEGIEILGNGNIKNSKMTGNLEIFAVGVNGDAKLSVANISIKDYDVDSIDDNYINGVFTITLSDAICDELAKEFDLPKTITDYLKKGSVVVSITSNEGKGSVTLAVLYDSKDVIEVSVNIAENKASNVKIPENAIKIQEESDLLYYVENINLDTIKSNLKAAGAPSDLVDALFLQMGQQDNHVEDNSPNFSYSDNLDYGGMYY
ncbi:MAG: hypothetical protein IIX60_05850, partial [Clostridia bacterium]|nr:hypothetical protein [Clostridia bacterium]